jgi:cytochrome P450
MKRKYPPGPRDRSFGLALGRRFRGHTLEFITDVSRNYGDLSYFRLGPYQVYFVNHPALVREVLVHKAKQFTKVASSTRVLSQIDGQGLAVSGGDFWLRQRRLVQPAFQARRLGHYADITVEYTRRLTERWRPGGAIDVADEMTHLALDVIAKALFDVEIGDQVEQLREAVGIFAETLFKEVSSAPLKLPDWLPLPAKRRKRWATRTVDSLSRSIIRERRRTGEDKGDLLSMLLMAVDEVGNGKGMTDEQARDEAVTLFRAGHDATAAGLAWIWYLLARHPGIEAQLIDEVDAVLGGRPATYADLSRLPYTEMVVKESLRLYPPTWALFAREPITDVELGGYSLPRGAMVFIFPWGVHRNPRFFENAEAFDPRRFAADRVERLVPGAYIPFGLGPHLCIGASFATMQMALTVATVLQRFRLTLAPGPRTGRAGAPHRHSAEGGIAPGADQPHLRAGQVSPRRTGCRAVMFGCGRGTDRLVHSGGLSSVERTSATEVIRIGGHGLSPGSCEEGPSFEIEGSDPGGRRHTQLQRIRLRLKPCTLSNLIQLRGFARPEVGDFAFEVRTIREGNQCRSGQRSHRVFEDSAGRSRVMNRPPGVGAFRGT